MEMRRTVVASSDGQWRSQDLEVGVVQGVFITMFGQDHPVPPPHPRLQRRVVSTPELTVSAVGLHYNVHIVSTWTNLIHGKKCVISRDVSENMPNFTENTRKEFQTFTENSWATQTLFRRIC